MYHIDFAATYAQLSHNFTDQIRAVMFALCRHGSAASQVRVSADNYIDAVASAVRDQTPRDELPADGHDLAALFRLYALVARIKGQEATAADVHDAWSVWMLNRGEAHDAIRPFEDLPGDARRDDDPFVAAVRSAAGSPRSRDR
jgi:hypothetical protein